MNLHHMLENIPLEEKLPPKDFGLFATCSCQFHNGKKNGGWFSLCKFSDDVDELLKLGRKDNNAHMYSWQVVDMKSGNIIDKHEIKKKANST